VPDLPAAPAGTTDAHAPPRPPPTRESRRDVVIEILATAMLDLLLAEAVGQNGRGAHALSSR